MKIKAKNGETMFWVEKYRQIVRFVNGVVEVDDKVGKEMIAWGYKQEGVSTVSTPKTIVEPKKQAVEDKPSITADLSATQPKFKI